ncbi:hypothetical protein A3A93_05905 [Candidatus Roizmanbacteria bacterium RIFCSPLOWO2_01_FULL_38_12]|uniref:Ribbon-helix-helix protein CopG domain-containing protein n=1 Tax=Candidatus Roizmanbacteria bacterium RIFCSPLOWO2_01_FULL_38_12 TaxID=1802061 RepID=A0A1F7IVC9_9BACT|nr:MAG: hypothetical protein A2861_02905 [Candidatus Roizmanbacteria bacterium RIFCSPHIGHO2_01_FULL_38_15]OGK36253.1 MAG: hypothetical protein A3F59_00045 [Candidatus Roizmanbacteria bacterium RIFCSPHIGHO2_12_FULL_38_13]OGK47293.1 MAG: hypothetical protein A3A93_05905 [Candidatus Roizmanbacteria bacterium RIFCSPLOWO2_01_FULL_38_12]
MKVFYTATYQGEDEFGKFYKAIYDEVKRLGYEQLDDDAIKMNYIDYVKWMKKGRSAQLNNYEKKMNFIKKADICILETSAHSLGLGFMVQKSLEMGKPTIVLYYKDNVPYFLQGAEDEKLIVKSYDEKNYKKVLKNALSLAREKRDKRFNFFLSPKLLGYLEDVSNAQGVTKSKILRDLIVEHMRKRSIQ